MYESTFGAIKPDSTKVLVLFSGLDQCVPESVDKEELVGTWIRVMKEKRIRVDEERSGIVEGANHDLKGVKEVVLEDAVERVKGFLKWVEMG